jgi:iron-sulfur cluster assembly accessory protein
MDQELQGGNLDCAEEPLLTLTDTAVAMIKQVMKRASMKDGGIRMTVAGGGCRGFQYSLQLVEAAHANDEVVVQKGITAFLDPVSARHLRGTLLDYVSNRHGTGFHFFRLDASHTIGCGSSILLRRCIAGNTRTTGCIQSAKRPLLELSHEVTQPSVDNRSSISHPNLRPLSLCNTCRYVICRCQQETG